MNNKAWKKEKEIGSKRLKDVSEVKKQKLCVCVLTLFGQLIRMPPTSDIGMLLMLNNNLLN